MRSLAFLCVLAAAHAAIAKPPSVPPMPAENRAKPPSVPALPDEPTGFAPPGQEWVKTGNEPWRLQPIAVPAVAPVPFVNWGDGHRPPPRRSDPLEIFHPWAGVYGSAIPITGAIGAGISRPKGPAPGSFGAATPTAPTTIRALTAGIRGVTSDCPPGKG